MAGHLDKPMRVCVLCYNTLTKKSPDGETCGIGGKEYLLLINVSLTKYFSSIGAKK